MSGIALILAGHGSHISANTAGVVWACVDRLRQLGVADEITACFWKEPPAFSQVLGTVEADDVVVVPLFTARGYFTQQVLPSEMGLSAPLTRRGKRRIYLTPTIGEHKILASIIDERLDEALLRFDLSAEETAVAVIGHGTRRNRASRDTARGQAERLRGAGYAGEVVAVYLDDDPNIASVYHSTGSPNIIALPYFLAAGSHVSLDVPRALGISGKGGAERVNGRVVYYCDPVGVDASLSEVILALARDTGLPFEPGSSEGPWSRFPAAGRRVLRQALEAGETLHLGQVSLDAQRVWHRDNSKAGRSFRTPAALRQYVRENPFRPLPSSVDLPAGWQVDLERPDEAQAIVETIYPGLIADWAAASAGRLATDSLADISARQAGMFKGIHKLSSAVIEKTIEVVCGRCVRQPTWRHDSPTNGGGLPCRSACNFWLSTARYLGEAQ